MNCENLEKKYNQILLMLKESFDLFENELIKIKEEKHKKNSTIIAYKKRVNEQLIKLKEIVASQQEIIELYKKENLALKKENLLLKNKFKKTAEKFSNQKEDKLLYKYFKTEDDLNKFLEKVVNKLFISEFKIDKLSPFVFRTKFNQLLKIYLIKNLLPYTKIEKIALLLSNIILKKYLYKIYLFTAEYLLDRVDDEKYQEFFKHLFNDKFLYNDEKIEPIVFEYSLVEILSIVKKYKKLSLLEIDKSVKLEINNLENEFNKTKYNIENLNKELEVLEQKENDILLQLKDEEDEENKKSLKESLNKIDEDKRDIKNKINNLKNHLTQLEHKQMFLTPLDEVNKVSDNREIVDNYNKLLKSFALTLQKGMINE